MRPRKLMLRKETLTELASEDLSSVVGASDHCVTHSVVLTGCMCTGAYPSLNIDCSVSVTQQLIQDTLLCR